MKKYRLKEQYIDKFALTDLVDKTMPIDEWTNYGFAIRALEEVPERIELERHKGTLDCILTLQKKNGDMFSIQEKDLCEKALNGELLDIDSLDDEDFEDWYFDKIDDGMSISEIGIKSVLKEYLKHKNNE